MKKKRIYQIILLVIYISLIAFFIYQCLKTGAESAKESSKVGDVIADTIEATTTYVVKRDNHYYTLIRKLVGHYGFFVVLGTVSWLLYTSIDKLNYYVDNIIHFVSGFGFAFFSEFVLEYSTQGRGASISDVFLDFGGFCTISLILFIIFTIIEIKKQKKVNLCS